MGLALKVETVIDATAREFIGWGVSAAGPVLIVQSGSQRVTVAMPPADAREVGCGAIFAAGVAAQAEAVKQGAAPHGGSSLVGSDGLPLGEGVRRG